MVAVAPIEVPRVPFINLDKVPHSWEGVGIPLDVFVEDGPDLHPHREFGATARLGWNDEGLVTRIDVVDPTPYLARDPNRPADGDSIELWMGLGDSAPQIIRMVVDPGNNGAPIDGSANGGNGRGDIPAHVKFFDLRGDELSKKGAPVGRAVRGWNVDGYSIEAILPWKNLGIQPKVGQELSARLAVNDGAEGRPRNQLMWMGNLRQRDPNVLPPIRLVAKASPPPTMYNVWSAVRPDQTTLVVNVVSDVSQAGRTVTISNIQPTEKEPLTADGPRAVAHLEVHLVAGQPRPANLSVSVGGVGDFPIE